MIFFSQYAADVTTFHVSPAYGPTLGSTSIVVSGSTFVDTGAIVVRFSQGSTVADVNATFVSASQIHCWSPAFDAVEATVVVALNGQQFSTVSSSFTYYGTSVVIYRFLIGLTGANVAISGTVPASGPVGGGTALRILGQNFVNTSEILIRFSASGFVGNVTATFIAANVVACISPARMPAGSVSVDIGLNSQQFTQQPVSFLAYSMCNGVAVMVTL